MHRPARTRRLSVAAIIFAIAACGVGTALWFHYYTSDVETSAQRISACESLSAKFELAKTSVDRCGTDRIWNYYQLHPVQSKGDRLLVFAAFYRGDKRFAPLVEQSAKSSDAIGQMAAEFLESQRGEN